jgi:hypothetical protein
LKKIIKIQAIIILLAIGFTGTTVLFLRAPPNEKNFLLSTLEGGGSVTAARATDNPLIAAKKRF